GFLGQGLSDRRHAIVLARALLIVADLKIEITRMLAPDDRDRGFRRQAFFAMARAAEPRLVLNRIPPNRGRRREERDHNNATQHERESFARAKFAPICARQRLKVKQKAASPQTAVRGKRPAK